MSYGNEDPKTFIERIFTGGLEKEETNDPINKLGKDEYLHYKKIEYIIRFLKYCCIVRRISLEEELYDFISGCLDDKQSEIIFKMVFGNKTSKKTIEDAYEKLSKSKEINKSVICTLIQFLEQEKIIFRTEKNKSDLEKKFNELKTFFDLTDTELEIILTLYLLSNEKDFNYIFSTGHKEARKRIDYISIFINEPVSCIKKTLSNNSNLRKYGILDEDNGIENSIIEFLNGLNAQPLCSMYFSIYTAETMSLENFVKQEKHIKIITNIIRNKKADEGTNILLYGAPGTGKTEFSRSIGKLLGGKIYEINHFDKDGDPLKANKMFTAFNVCRKAASQNKDILIIDEADEMLNGSGGLLMFLMNERNKDKGIINKILDDSKHVCIWITNEYYFIEESTKRRFDYSIKFEKLSADQRKIIWTNAVKKHRLNNIISNHDINNLAKQYEISAGGINIALKNSVKILQSEAVSILDALDTVLKPYQELMGCRTIKQQSGLNKYRLDGVNVKGNISLNNIVDISDRFYRHLENKKDFLINNMNVLLSGPPGTGKTEFVKHLGEKLDKTIIIKTGSDLLNMHLGGTEKNIKKAFEEAENEKTLLFIDEVDGIFSSRANASKSWEITQVNELLAQMENFRGIFIAATNFKKNIDPAAIRRFNLKVEFDYLNNSGKKLFFEKLLNGITERKLTKNEENRLNKITCLTPGDYKVVWQKHYFLSNKNLTNINLIDSLEEEVEAKNSLTSKVIGFALRNN